MERGFGRELATTGSAERAGRRGEVVQLARLALGAGRRRRRRGVDAVRLSLERLESRWALTTTSNRIYYDYLEGETLKGGWIEIDPTNPFHVDTGLTLAEGTSGVAGTSGSLSSPPRGAAVGEAVETVVNNGPTSNRVDLVFIGDGYTQSQLADYAGDVARIVPRFLAKAPLDEYASYFNVHRVDVVSTESGIDNDPTQGVQRNTALDMNFFCNGIARLLCVNVGKARQAADAAPEVDQILAIGNTPTYGGAGYASADLATFSSDNTSAIEIGIHEFGHSFADLADEYDTGGPTNFVGAEPIEPNVSKQTAEQMLASQTKWARWLDVPGVGTFEGAKYSLKGIYRPTSNSIMRTLGRQFESVNAEQIVINIYREVKPVDDWTPPGTYPHDHTFFVKPLKPATHSLDITWLVNGNPVPAAANQAQFQPSSLTLTPGTHEVTVRIVDNTSLVRDEQARQDLMTSTRSWTVTVPEPVAAKITDRRIVYANTPLAAAAPNLAAMIAPRPSDIPSENCVGGELCGKQALLPGETANLTHYISTVQGITGVAFSIEGAPDINAGDVVARMGNSADFAEWKFAPDHLFQRMRDDDPTTPDQVFLTWPAGSILNTWLEVTVGASPTTGLKTPDVFYFGHQLGQVVTQGETDRAVVDKADFQAIAGHFTSFLTPAQLDSPYDLNRDGLVDGSDLAIARDARTAPDTGLILWQAPVTPPAAPAPAPLGRRRSSIFLVAPETVAPAPPAARAADAAFAVAAQPTSPSNSGNGILGPSLTPSSGSGSPRTKLLKARTVRWVV